MTYNFPSYPPPAKNTSDDDDDDDMKQKREREREKEIMSSSLPFFDSRSGNCNS